MPSKVPCYLRTLRRKWGFTQNELAALVPRGRRARVSDVERGKIAPRASELLAYGLIFGVPPQAIFRKYAEDQAAAVLRGATALRKRLGNDGSPGATRKSALLHQLLERTALEINNTLTL